MKHPGDFSYSNGLDSLDLFSHMLIGMDIVPFLIPTFSSGFPNCLAGLRFPRNKFLLSMSLFLPLPVGEGGMRVSAMNLSNLDHAHTGRQEMKSEGLKMWIFFFSFSKIKR
jgi:hypothetical protein